MSAPDSSNPRLSSALLALVLIVLVGVPATWALVRLWKLHYGERPIAGLVVDETGQPVPEVEVTLQWSPGRSYVADNATTLRVMTDAAGRFAAQVGYTVCDVDLDKPEYYPTWLSLRAGQAVEGLRLPLNRLRRPQPMVGKRATVQVPVGFSRLEYDLLAGDCLPPHGRGVVADVVIEWTRADTLHLDTARRAFQFHILGEGNGLLLPEPKPEPDAPRSRLRSLHEAPEVGYRPTVELGREFDNRLAAYVKIRTGTAGGPLYGKMLNPTLYFPESLVDEFYFTYVINPSGDRGLEVDMLRLTVPAQGKEEHAPMEF